jgi:hypothetical protein
MAITNTTSEAKHGNRKTRATKSPAPCRHAADTGADRRRDSGRGPTSRPAARSSSDHKQASGSRLDQGRPIVELTIDAADEDELLERVADLLLALTEGNRAPQT